MKVITCFASMLYAFTCLSQIPNPGFENWETRFVFGIQYTDPQGWFTQNLSMIAEGLPANCVPTTDAHSGTKALKIANVLNPYFAAGYAATMRIEGTEFNEKFSLGGLKPYAFNGYYKYIYDVSEKDTLSITVSIFKNGNNIGYGTWMSDSLVNEYIQFSVPIAYYGPDSSLIPDSASIYISVAQPKDSLLHTSVTMYLDDVWFEGNMLTSMKDIFKNQLHATIFPNPIYQDATLVLDQTNTGNVSIVILDITGKIVSTILTQSLVFEGKHEYPLDMHELDAGIYFVRIQSADRSKVIKVYVE